MMILKRLALLLTMHRSNNIMSIFMKMMSSFHRFLVQIQLWGAGGGG